MPAAIPASILGDRFDRGVAFAMTNLRSDRRVSSHTAVARLFGVCASILEHGGTENEAIAGLIQGSIDRRLAVQQLRIVRESFGMETSAIVEGCSSRISASGVLPLLPLYDRTLSFVERLDAYARSSETKLAASVFFVSAAEALYEARVTSEALARGVDVDAFADFEGKKFGTLWSLRTLADSYLAYDCGDPEPGAARHLELAREIVERVSLMAGKPVVADELLAAFAIDDSVDARAKGSLVAREDAI